MTDLTEPFGLARADRASARSGARTALTSLVIVGALAISAGAGWVSYLTIRDLAVFFGWPGATAWLVMPLIELFLLVGSAELALRVLEADGRRAAPAVMAYGALVVTLGCNIADHTLRLVQAQPGVAQWRVVILGSFAAIVPVAQICALHLFTGRLMRMAAGRAVNDARAPGLLALARARMTQALVERLATRPAESFTGPVEPAAESIGRTAVNDSVPAGGVESLTGRLSDDELRDAARPFVNDCIVREGKVPGEHRVRAYVLERSGVGASTKRCGVAAREIAKELGQVPNDSPATLAR